MSLRGAATGELPPVIPPRSCVCGVVQGASYWARFFAFFSSSVSDEPLAPLVELAPSADAVPLASVDCEALPVADWSPVVAVDDWVESWSPVVVVAEELTDWSPVEVALSMVTLERPRRSIVGLTVDVDPVTDVFWSVEDPVMAESCVVEDPVTEGLAVALPVAERSVVADGLVETAAPLVPAARPLVPVAAAPVPEVTPFAPVVAACESGMQSM